MQCPDCGSEISAASRECSCGWKRGGKEGHNFRWATKVDGQWIDLQCAFNDHGVRCDRYGTISPSTNGRGPWYCGQHFGSSGAMDYGLQQKPVEHIKVEIPDNLAPSLRWAHRIMARVNAGDSVPLVAQEKARAALGTGMREPGEDEAA